LPVAPWRYVELGQRVRICNGPMSGLEGILSRQKSGDRLVVNVELLRCAAAVEVSSECIEPVRI
jgi:transcription antitermination factor NusG